MTFSRKTHSYFDQSEAKKFVTQAGRRHRHTGSHAYGLYSDVALAKKLTICINQYGEDRLQNRSYLCIQNGVYGRILCIICMLFLYKH